MADKKISQLTAASTPLAGTEVLPIVQSGSTVKVASDNLTVKNVRSNATTGILQVAGPGAGTTRTMTTPDANFTVARTDAGNAFTGIQTIDSNVAVGTTTVSTTLGRNITINGAGAGTNTGIIFSNASTENALAYSNSTNFVIGSRTNIPFLFTVNDGEVGRFTTSGNLAFPAAKGIDFSANTGAAGETSALLNWYEEGTFTATLSCATTPPTTPPTTTARYTRVGRQVTVQMVFADVNTTGGSGVIDITGLPFANSSTPSYGSAFIIGLGSADVVAYVQPSNSSVNLLIGTTGAYLNVTAGTGKYVGLTLTYTV